MNAPKIPNQPLLAFFGQERMDARNVKRINALQDQDWKVLAFTFHRENGRKLIEPAWENIHLGTTYNRRYGQRLCAIIGSLAVIWKQRIRLRTSRCFYVINADNALLALFARLVCRRYIPIALEIADIQPAMNDGGLIGRALRALERRVLHRSALLITTSPGFVDNYFTAVQKFTGEIFMLENKVYPSTALLETRSTRLAPVSAGNPWVIGYFGGFRCERTIDIICSLARALPEKIRFILRGTPTGIDPARFRDRMAAYPNISYDGGYTYPQDLPTMYQSVDLNWCFDFSVAGTNSTWLLPNRIYEGGLFHCPALAYEGTETARWITTRGLGWAFSEDLTENLRQFLDQLTPEMWDQKRANHEITADESFAGEADYARLSARLLALA